MERPGQYQSLIEQAWKARELAYAPYSRFAVGAAIMAASGQVYLGCNVENASYGLTICAERVAAFNAVATGERRFVALAVVADAPAIATPCGACRQVLSEFGGDTVVVAANRRGEVAISTVAQLLPAAFAPSQVVVHPENEVNRGETGAGSP